MINIFDNMNEMCVLKINVYSSFLNIFDLIVIKYCSK